MNRYRFPGFEIKARLFRNYPLGEIASHAVGYIGRINDAELKRIESSGLSTNYRHRTSASLASRQLRIRLHGRPAPIRWRWTPVAAIRSLARSAPTSETTCN